MRYFSREQITARNDNFDIAWLRDTSDDPEDEMTAPEDLVAALAGHLRAALEEIDAYGEELATETGEVAV